MLLLFLERFNENSWGNGFFAIRSILLYSDRKNDTKKLCTRPLLADKKLRQLHGVSCLNCRLGPKLPIDSHNDKKKKKIINTTKTVYLPRTSRHLASALVIRHYYLKQPLDYTNVTNVLCTRLLTIKLENAFINDKIQIIEN